MGSTALEVVDRETGEILSAASVQLGTLRATNAPELLAEAAAIAKALANVIEKQHLFSNISGKRHVRCEGWTTLAAMLGCTPHEISVEDRTGDGDYVATVEFRRLADGQPVARASAECGTDEARWKGRDRYARRSMALTRATGKASRLAFSWVMVLAGFDATPAEEMSHDDTAAVGASEKQLAFLRKLMQSSVWTDDEQSRVERWIDSSECTKDACSAKIDAAQQEISRRKGESEEERDDVAPPPSA